MNDEILISDIILEYYNDFLNQKNKFVELNNKIDNSLVIYSNSDIAMMINSKIKRKFENITADICKLEKWWNQYLQAMNELNNGFTITNYDQTFSTQFNDAKRIYNEELD